MARSAFGLKLTFFSLLPLSQIHPFSHSPISHIGLFLTSVWSSHLEQNHFTSSCLGLLFLAISFYHHFFYPCAISNRRPGLGSFEKPHRCLLAAHVSPFSQIHNGIAITGGLFPRPGLQWKFGNLDFSHSRIYNTLSQKLRLWAHR